jgi:pimeloyl-ACP methyl ester carboxylesterase
MKIDTIRTMPGRYFIWAVLLLVTATASAQQPPTPPAAAQATSASRGYTVFVGGMVIGREDVTVHANGRALTITGKGRLTGSQDVVIQRAEVRYRADGTAEAFELEASVNGNDSALYTTFTGTTAATKGIDGGKPVAQSDTVSPQVVILPNVFFASYEVLTRRLATAEPGQEFPAFIGAGTQGTVRLINSDSERVQVGTSAFTVRRYGLALNAPRGVIPLSVYADESGALVRVSIPGQGVEVMRDDLAAATSRTVVHSNPTDEAANIPAAGFNLGATLTLPRRGAPAGAPAAALRMPAVILLASEAANERDGMVGGIPVLGQLAGALADAGFLVVRYDKRGHGQSGGRPESATLTDHAEDALAVFRWLSNRRDVDRDRIAIVGHNEGAWAALLAATRERRIAGVVSIAAPSTAGAERVLERQRHVLDRMNLTPAERVERIEQQRRINAAATTGKGWEALAPDVRKQADTPWFQSFLAFDPARVIQDVRQPVLFIHGDLDAEVPVSHVDRLAGLAQKGRSRAVAVVTVREANHMLVPAITGDPREYAALKDLNVSPEATRAIGDWLTKTLAPTR